MKILGELQPSVVWEYFEEICQVPRPSKKEEKIIDYLLAFGEKQGLPTKRDAIGNVLISKSGTPGKENLKTVVLQSHVDMVCEKNGDVEFDFDQDAIQPYVEGNWVKAKGTTLGADDGIGIAAQLALLASKDVAHGPIECLFTVDEETGLTGAFELQSGFFEGKILLNLDSEDEGELFIGCAGGIDTLATFEYKTKKVPSDSVAFEISVKGLKGGHSGDEIDKGLGNSNKILNRFLWKSARKYPIRLSSFDGGNLRNAIPREASAVFTVKKAFVEEILRDFQVFYKDQRFELQATEPEFTMTIDELVLPDFVINKKAQKNLFNALYACPHGVYAMSQSIKGLVETSTNLASVKFMENNRILVTTSQRSSVKSSINDISSMVRAVFEMAGAIVKHTDGYPGWTPNTDSEILKVTEASYEKLFGIKPVVRAIHAGLECGLFLEKYPDLDMISFGPTIKGAHSPDERIDIETTQKFWDLLLDVLAKIPEK